MYVKKNLNFKIINNLVVDGFHNISIELFLNGKFIDIHGIYRPPSFAINMFCDKLEYMLSSVADNHSCFVIGDMNILINRMNNNALLKYKSILESYGFACTNSFPTRPKSQNILDHVISKSIDIARITNDTIFNDISDHLQIITTFDLLVDKKTVTLEKTIINHTQLNNLFSEYLQRTEFADNVETCLQNITSTYNSLLVQCSKKITR